MNKGAICTRTAPLFWNFISLFQGPRTRLVRKIGSRNQSNRLILIYKCMHIHICVYIHTYTHMCIYTHVYINIYILLYWGHVRLNIQPPSNPVQIRICEHVHTYYIYISIYIYCGHVRLYILPSWNPVQIRGYIYTYVYIHIYIHIYIYVLWARETVHLTFLKSCTDTYIYTHMCTYTYTL